MEYGLIGYPLGHSYSPEIHGRIADYKYELNAIPENEVGEFLTKREFKAINVTIPYKQTVIPYLDEISERAKKIGAVNTIVNRSGKLYGDNTDFMGLLALIKFTGIDLNNAKVLILGTGGTSKTAKAVCEDGGAREIIKVSRSGKDGAVTYEQAVQEHDDADVIINCTPAGLSPKSDGLAIDITPFNNLRGIIDAVYNPLRTNFVLDGTEKGIPSNGGLYMLAGQAVYASALFQGKDLSDELIYDCYRHVRNQKRNIVLIGMPSSGKSTVGKMLSEKTSTPLIELDGLIVDKIGMPISEYMPKFGEKAFRDVESEVIREVSEKTGCIISTGGGCVLRGENVRALKHNGFVVFLNRNVDKLLVTSDRPLSSSKEAIEKMWETRQPLYLAAADVIADGNGDIIDEVSFIIEEADK